MSQPTRFPLIAAMESASAQDLRGVVARVALTGRTGGRVKQLRGFDKSRHTAPDAVNATTSAFLGRLCAAELAEEAETWFQRTKTALGYKRRDVSLDLASPSAVLTARDFTFELNYALDDRAPDQFTLTRTLHQLNQFALVREPTFDGLFAGTFSELGFHLLRGVRVEAVIDAVEDLNDETRLRVDYPSDCRFCTLSVPGVEAVVTCDGATLTMVFPRSGSPAELFDAFLLVRQAFALSEQPSLAGLLGD